MASGDAQGLIAPARSPETRVKLPFSSMAQAAITTWVSAFAVLPAQQQMFGQVSAPKHEVPLVVQSSCPVNNNGCRSLGLAQNTYQRSKWGCICILRMHAAHLGCITRRGRASQGCTSRRAKRARRKFLGICECTEHAGGRCANPVWTYEDRPAACKPCGQPNSLAENLGTHCEFWGCIKTARVHPQDATVKFLGRSLIPTQPPIANGRPTPVPSAVSTHLSLALQGPALRKA